MCSLFVFSWHFTLILKIHKVYDSLSVKCSYKENTACNCCRNVEHFLFCIRAFALHLQQPEKDKQNVDFAHPWEISADAHAWSLIYLMFFLQISTFSPLSTILYDDVQMYAIGALLRCLFLFSIDCVPFIIDCVPFIIDCVP